MGIWNAPFFCNVRIASDHFLWELRPISRITNGVLTCVLWSLISFSHWVERLLPVTLQNEYRKATTTALVRLICKTLYFYAFCYVLAIRLLSVLRDVRIVWRLLLRSQVLEYEWKEKRKTWGESSQKKWKRQSSATASDSFSRASFLNCIFLPFKVTKNLKKVNVFDWHLLCTFRSLNKYLLRMTRRNNT